jgi:hypothetical protein
VVTHHTTNQPACGLSTAERTGSPVLHTLWSYVLVVPRTYYLYRQSFPVRPNIKTRREMVDLLKCGHCFLQLPSVNKRFRDNGKSYRASHKQQLQRCVDFRDPSWLHLRRRERKVPVPGHGLWRRKRNPTVVECGNRETNVPTENDHGEPYYAC